MCDLVGLEELCGKASVCKYEGERPCPQRILTWDTQTAVSHLAHVHRRRELSRAFDSAILLCGATSLEQAQAAGDLLTDCLAIVHPLLIANRKKGSLKGTRIHSQPWVRCIGCQFATLGTQTSLTTYGRLLVLAPKPSVRTQRADLGHRLGHATPHWPGASECSQEM